MYCALALLKLYSWDQVWNRAGFEHSSGPVGVSWILQRDCKRQCEAVYEILRNRFRSQHAATVTSQPRLDPRPRSLNLAAVLAYLSPITLTDIRGIDVQQFYTRSVSLPTCSK